MSDICIPILKISYLIIKLLFYIKYFSSNMSSTFLFVIYNLEKWKDIAYFILYGLNPHPWLSSLVHWDLSPCITIKYSFEKDSFDRIICINIVLQSWVVVKRKVNLKCYNDIDDIKYLHLQGWDLTCWVTNTSNMLTFTDLPGHFLLSSLLHKSQLSLQVEGPPTRDAILFLATKRDCLVTW